MTVLKIKQQKAHKCLSSKESLGLKTAEAVMKQLNLKMKKIIQKKVKLAQIVLRKVINNSKETINQC